jgi:hypothetical protein
MPDPDRVALFNFAAGRPPTRFGAVRLASSDVSRETKFNLVFLAGFLLLSLPGVVLLFIKKMDPEARSMAEASYVRRTEVYNNPLPTGSKTVRFVPPLTFDWVDALAREHLGIPPLRHAAAGGRLEPVMSENRRFELLDLEDGSDQVVVVLLAWDGVFGHERVNDLSAESEELGRLAGIEVLPVPLPPEVTADLKDAGLVVPPARVAVVWLRFAPGARSVKPSIRLSWSTPDGRGTDVLDLRRRLLERPGDAKEPRPPPDDVSGPAVASDGTEGQD